MTHLAEWATRWRVPQEALAELLMMTYQPEVASGLSGEAAVQQLTRAEAPHQGGYLWRNNVGACQDETGRMVRYGLGNDSAKLCAVFKSSDLIGVTPITDPMSGHTYGVFTAVECKKPTWRGPSSKHDQAQARFHLTAQRAGAIAGFASDVTHYRQLIADYKARL